MAGVSFKVRGDKELLRNLRRINDTGRELIRLAVVRAAVRVQARAIRSIQRGPKTGHIYTRGNVSHQASAPGQPPATDYGILVNSIKVVQDMTKQPVAAVGTGLDYGAFLEFGTRRVEARPWLVPAVEAETGRFFDELGDAYREALRKHTIKGAGK